MVCLGVWSKGEHKLAVRNNLLLLININIIIIIMSRLLSITWLPVLKEVLMCDLLI